MRSGLPRFMAITLYAGVFAGCASAPEMREAGDVFHSPLGFFSCAVPGRAQFFQGASELAVSGVLVKFRDPANPAVTLEINAAGIHGVYQEEYAAKGRAANGVWRMLFERGFVSFLDEVEMEPRPGLYVRMGVTQFPYYQSSASYMGQGLAAQYRASSEPPPVVRVVANLMVEETHYTAIYTVPAHWFLPEGVPLRDVEAVRRLLLERIDRITPRLTEALAVWLAECELTAFAKAQVPYQPPTLASPSSSS